MDSGFLTTLMSFPAVVFTALLLMMALYWCLVIIGALDLDFMVHSGLDDLFDAAGSAGVPITVILSVLVLTGWCILMPLTHYVILPLPGETLRWGAGAAALFGVGLLSLWLTTHLIKPFKPLFHAHSAYAGEHLLGKLCVITTSRVDEKFGQAIYEDKGAGLLLSVQADTPNQLQKGSKAVILSYDKQNHSYTVAAYDEII